MKKYTTASDYLTDKKEEGGYLPKGTLNNSRSKTMENEPFNKRFCMNTGSTVREPIKKFNPVDVSGANIGVRNR